MVETARGAKRLLYWLMAGVFFLLAMLGVALPGIPTTPFLLLMCYFLLRVSPAMHAKAMAWPLVGGPLRDWRDQGGVRRSVKHLAYGMVTLVVGSTLIFGQLSVMLKIIVASASIYGVSVVARLPIARDELGDPGGEFNNASPTQE
jgi:uncharacterized membrane protein YbaN (DUF454 family)